MIGPLSEVRGMEQVHLEAGSAAMLRASTAGRPDGIDATCLAHRHPQGLRLTRSIA